MATTGMPLGSPDPQPDPSLVPSSAPETQPLRVLWTGGWDSTFRVCMLVLVQRVPVRPYYLFVGSRKGSGLELATIQRLKRMIRAKDPAAGALILPTTIVERDELVALEHRQAQYDALLRQRFLGDQYVPLAALCDLLSIDDLELCVHRDDQAHRHLAGHVVPEGSAASARMRLDPTLPADAPIRLFEAFRFPVLDVDKLQMQALSRQHGFFEIMAATWFCHSPRNDKPCGVCNPCEYAREEGLGWRVPWSGRLRAASIKTLRRSRMLLFDPAAAMQKLAQRLRTSRD